MDGHDGEDPKQSTADMTIFVQNLLQQMQSRFQAMSESIITKNILSAHYMLIRYFVPLLFIVILNSYMTVGLEANGMIFCTFGVNTIVFLLIVLFEILSDVLQSA
ncbi:hypothetical protein Ancab_013564 [Ancistrocladus abbreviatus]